MVSGGIFFRAELGEPGDMDRPNRCNISIYQGRYILCLIYHFKIQIGRYMYLFIYDGATKAPVIKSSHEKSFHVIKLPRYKSSLVTKDPALQITIYKGEQSHPRGAFEALTCSLGARAFSENSLSP